MAIVLGAIQGLTEFLPVSSSGHLVLGAHLLGLAEPDVFFDVVLHVGTLLAVVVFYRADLWRMAQEIWQAPGRGRQAAWARPDVRRLWLLFVACLPTGVIGLVFKDPLEALFAEPRAAAAMLLVTASLLVATRFAPTGSRTELNIGWWRAALIGLAQGIAIVPGISRSGATIATALFLGVERETAARFSFLLSIPAILGALVLQLEDGVARSTASGLALGLGFAAAAAVGLASLAVLIPLVRRGKFHWFAAYLIPVGVAGLVLLP